jgi:hypothetical protein
MNRRAAPPQLLMHRSSQPGSQVGEEELNFNPHLILGARGFASVASFSSFLDACSTKIHSSQCYLAITPARPDTLDYLHRAHRLLRAESRPRRL